MSNGVPDHERLFDEISSKLNELSRVRNEVQEDPVGHQEKMDRLQTQVRHFHSELQSAQSELREKIKNLESLQVPSGEINQQLKQLNDQLQAERAITSKLNSDLAKSLEMGLQLQLEIQNLKSRLQHTQHDLDLSKALKDETETELERAQGEIAGLNADLEKLSSSFTELQDASLARQQESLKNLAQVAESKIVELKLALDRKGVECNGLEAHLGQALTQNQLLRQENANLKDYIAKIGVYLQNQQAPSIAASSPAPGTGGVVQIAAPSSSAPLLTPLN